MAQQRSHVPKFGNWENEEHVPYTAYFDKARKGRTSGGKMINPNDPEENPDIQNDPPPPPPPSSVETSLSKGKPEGVVVVKPTQHQAHERHKSREDTEPRQFANSPANNHGNARTRSGERKSGGAQRQSLGSENSIEKSPLHRHGRPAATGRDSPSWEGKSSGHDASHGTPGRSRLRPRGDDTPDHGAAVPKFGEWDETNPASADGFTHIFNKVREERQIGAGRVGTPEPSYPNKRRPGSDDAAKGCCFGIFKK